MKKALRTTLFVVALTLVLCGSGAAWYVLSPPAVENLALAPELVAVSSAEGQRLLAASEGKTDFSQLSPHVVGQARRAFCGPATSVAVINAARRPQPPVTQASLFESSSVSSKGEIAVSIKGLTLDELASLLRGQGMQVKIVHADSSSLAAFREVLRATVAEPKTFLVVNYDRKSLKQTGAGHISPVGAYEPATDRALVLDVATQKYPFTWVPLTMLWDAMNTTDSDSRAKRGYLLVSSS